MKSVSLTLLAVISIAACRDAETKADEQAKPIVTTKQTDKTNKYQTTPLGSGSDDKKGDQQDQRWVPAEFKTGAARWKDTVVYVDGKPIGFLNFGELPITLKPTWVKDKVSDNKPPGCPIEKCPGWKWAQQRFYKFTDYLKAIGIDLRKVKELHAYASKFTQTIIVNHKDLLSPAAEKFLFHFGADTYGKVIPALPPNFGNGKSPDKLTSVMIYIDKTPPVLQGDTFALDGQPVLGVPYYGEPLRGGVRVYLDDKLVAIIKRQELDPKKSRAGADGELHWSFADFLVGKNVDTSKLVEGWVIRDERRKEKLPWSALSQMDFTASSQASGGVELGDAKIKANSIALHTRAIADDELPKILPEEE